MRDPNEIARKYDDAAQGYSSRYANRDAVAAFYVEAVRSWGRPLPRGSSVLEVGCADGFMTEALVRAGYRVTGLDISPRMIEVAERRLRDAGINADLRVADVNGWEPDGDWDAVLAAMWTFFGYAEDPASVLQRLARAATVKVVVDLNPRGFPTSEALAVLRSAGLRDVGSRPVLIPLTRRVGPAGLRMLRAAGGIPPVRDALLRRKFNVALKGDVA